MSDLVGHLGLARQSVYDTFGDKHAIYMAALRRYCEQRLAWMVPLFRGERPVRAILREYLEHEFKVDEPARMAWCRHWHTQALAALEVHLGTEETGRFCHGDQVTIADICLASQAAGAKFFGVDTAPFPNFARIAEACHQIDAFARAHPLLQSGAPST